MNRSPAPRLALAPLFLFALLVATGGARAQTLVSHAETTSFSSGFPEDISSTWTRVGTAPVLMLDGGELLLNDNSTGAVVAYQGLLGQLVASHDVILRGELKVYSNLGGQAALIEVSRPGMEVVVELYPEGIRVVERLGRGAPRWLGEASVDLSKFHELEVHKASLYAPVPEEVTVRVDDTELLRVQPHGGGELEVGRVVFGSLGYGDLGATVWHWVEVRAELEQAKTPAFRSSVGQLKDRYTH